MAERPIFVPFIEGNELVKEVFLPLVWHSGFAAVQKEKNVKGLHESAAKAGLSPLLEISSSSDSKRGRHLSAFHIRVSTSEGEIPLECAFQGSKVFIGGGPYTDLYAKKAGEAKRDPRLRGSGPLKGFLFEGVMWPLEPKTAFYDWLYISFLEKWRDWGEKLCSYAGFTDIEFNPYRSINCQARSCALFVALLRRDLLDQAVKSPSDFIRVLSNFDYRPELHVKESPLFSTTG